MVFSDGPRWNEWYWFKASIGFTTKIYIYIYMKGTINKLQGFLLSRWEAHVKKFVVSLLWLLNDTPWKWDLVACWASGGGSPHTKEHLKGGEQTCPREGYGAFIHFEETLWCKVLYSIQIIAIFQSPQEKEKTAVFILRRSKLRYWESLLSYDLTTCQL